MHIVALVKNCCELKVLPCRVFTVFFFCSAGNVRADLIKRDSKDSDIIPPTELKQLMASMKDRGLFAPEEISFAKMVQFFHWWKVPFFTILHEQGDSETFSASFKKTIYEEDDPKWGPGGVPSQRKHLRTSKMIAPLKGWTQYSDHDDPIPGRILKGYTGLTWSACDLVFSTTWSS